MERKRPKDVVPQSFGKLFEGFDFFNEMQNVLLDDLLKTDKSMVISAPTGSGKTVAFELAIVRMLQNAQANNNNKNSILPKTIYIAPIKALCNEKFTDWKIRFDSIGVNCTQLTGDTESANLTAIRKAQIVITTPEKWDSLTRRWRDFDQLLPAVQLFIVDEVHLLNENTRGPILEAIIARMKSSGVRRFIVASATIPNVEDLTSWIRGNGCNMNTVVQHVFNEMQRPVPLEKHVIGFHSKLRGFQFDMRLNYQLPDVLRKYAENKASLVFCNSRKSAEMAAFYLYKSSSVFSLNENQKMYLMQLAPRLSDVKLRKLVENGIAYHHAGLQYTDRSLIETGFRQGFLMVLISTSTLAMGINLPAHLVVIKSTETYNCGAYTEYPENMIFQMIGRAGRPQYDTKGIAVILTQQKNVKKYQELMNGQVPIESHLHKNLTEHLNSEIALNTIKNLEMSMNWIRSTYLYIRSVRNPKHYGFDTKLTKVFVEHKLEELCLQQIKALNGAGLVKFNPCTGSEVQTTSYGKLMAKYYICFETMKSFQQLQGKESLEDFLNLLIKCKEMKEFSLRVNEKKYLNEINKSPIRFPIKGRIKNNDEKISCIIQAVLGNIDITATNLIQESLKIIRISDRISKCLLEYVRLRIREHEGQESQKIGWYNAMLNVIILTKCLHVKLWENSEYILKQLNGIGPVYADILVKHGKTTLKALANTEARTIENMLNKSAPFGDKILENLMSFPEYQLKLERQAKWFVKVIVKQVNEHYIYKYGNTTLFILGDSNNQLLHMEEKLDDSLMEFGIYERSLKIQNAEEVNFIYGHVIHLSLVGVDANATLEINAPVNIANTSLKPKKQSRFNITINTSFKENSIINDENVNYNKENYNAKNKTLSSLDTSKSRLQTFYFKKTKMKNFAENDASILNETGNDLKEISLNSITASDITQNETLNEMTSKSATSSDIALNETLNEMILNSTTAADITRNDSLNEVTFNSTNATSITLNETLNTDEQSSTAANITSNETLNAKEHLTTAADITRNETLNFNVHLNSTTNDCFNSIITDCHNLKTNYERFESIKTLSNINPTAASTSFNNLKRNSDVGLKIIDKRLQTTITSNIKQTKLTDFFNKHKQNEKPPDHSFHNPINLRKNIFDKQMEPPPNNLKRPLELQKNNEKTETTPSKQCKIQRTETHISPAILNLKRKFNSNESEKSFYSSSDEIPSTMIPNPKKQMLSYNVDKNIIKERQQQELQKKQRHVPFTLASFLFDPNELNTSKPMLALTPDESRHHNKLKEKTNNIIETKNNTTKFDNQNSIDILKEMLLENRKIQNLRKFNSEQINFDDAAKSFKFSTHENNENIETFNFINSQNKIYKQEKITPEIVPNVYASSKSSNDESNHNSTISIDDTNNKSINLCKKYLFKFKKPNNSFEKLLKYESLFKGNRRYSPLTQTSPMDLSKNNNINNKNNNKNNNCTYKRRKMQDAATQVNLDFNDNNKTSLQLNTMITTSTSIQILKFWHTVALEFSKLSILQSLSFENFQRTYTKVQQQQSLSSILSSSLLLMPPPPPPQSLLNFSSTLNSNSSRNDKNQTISITPSQSKSKNLASLKIKNSSTFRLQLFANGEDEEKAMAKAKLNSREIKLINKNVMNLVFERKCKEINKEHGSNNDLDRKSEIQNEFERLERELSINIDCDDFFSVKGFKNNNRHNNDDDRNGSDQFLF